MRCVLALLLFCLSNLAGPAVAGPAEVHAAIAERLSLMRPVAAWKLANDVAVEDLAREAVVIEKATKAAAEEGLDPAGAELFFQAQIEAAKAIQYCWLERWKGVPPDEEAPDLVSEIRPELIRLGERILSEIRAALDAGDTLGPSSAFSRAIALDCLPPERAEAIASALGGITLAE